MDTSKVGSGSVNLDGKGTTRRVTLNDSPMMSNSSPLISPSTTINMPRGLYSIDVAATFEVPLTTVGDLHKLIIDIETGKRDELLSGMTNDDRMETLDAIGTICKLIQADNNNADVIPCKVSHVDCSINLIVDESTKPSDPIIQSVDINTKSTSYAGAAGVSAKDQPKVNSNFRTLVANPVFDGVNISIPCKVVEKEQVAETSCEKIMMNSKGFFFFKFNLRDGWEAVLEGGPWLIRKSLIIHIQTSSMCNESWVRSSFTRCRIEVNSELISWYISNIGIPSLSGDAFTKETIRVEYEWRPPRCDICKIFGHVHDHCPKKVVSPPIVTTSNIVTLTVEKTDDGFQTVGKKKKRKGKSKSTNGGQFVGPSVKQNVRYEPKVTTSAPKKGVTNVGNTSQSTSMLKTTGYSSKKDNLSMSNSFSALNDEEEDDEEEVQNVYDESANLLQNTKAYGSSSFTATAG
ncbi:zinc knuckle CX2CX4HX4C containing protein [Tanacetum coccineum]